MLVNATDALSPDSPASPVSLTAATATALFTPGAESTGGVTGGAGTGSAPGHNGVLLSADSANTAVVYVLLGTGTPSATNWHVALPAGATWDGTIGGAVWRGAISAFCSAAAKVGILIA